MKHKVNLLAIDYGTAKIGLAIAQGPLAEPLITVDADHAMNAIQDTIKKYSVNKIIIGNSSKEFLEQLNHLKIEIEQVDETLSSRDARVMVSHKAKFQRKNAEHSAAAAIILQNFLDLEAEKL